MARPDPQYLTLMTLLTKALAISAVGGLAAIAGVASYIAYPPNEPLVLAPPLESIAAIAPSGPYSVDFHTLRAAFEGQKFRSFCGPASVATVSRAFGKHVDQTTVFSSRYQAVDVFFSGMSLSELERLAKDQGMRAERVHADSLSLHDFRARLTANLAQPGNYVLVNYDRQALNQVGAGHISPVGSYDEASDRFLILDEAAYRYPFTWVSAQQLYSATRTRADGGWRGVLFLAEGSQRL
jgi:hypothetical protein